MRVVVTGASGNIGTSLLTALASDPAVTSIVGLARRLGGWQPPGQRVPVEWVTVDLGAPQAGADLAPVLRGADAVVHLAWLLQPSHDEIAQRRANVEGTRRLLQAVVDAEVGAVVYASSVGVYSPGPKDRVVDESWPTDGVRTLAYSRQKAEVERLLDAFEANQPRVRVVRIRPGLVLQRAAAAAQRRYFAGPLFPNVALRSSLLPVVPDIPRLRFQVVHASDVAEAFHQAVMRDVQGAFNLAAEPVLDPRELEAAFGARRVPVPAPVLRAAATASWLLRLQPSAPGWLDLILSVPLMSADRARRELGWVPQRQAVDTLREVLEGVRDEAGLDTPPLDPAAGGPLRLREVLTGVGGRSGA